MCVGECAVCRHSTNIKCLKKTNLQCINKVLGIQDPPEELQCTLATLGHQYWSNEHHSPKRYFFR